MRIPGYTFDGTRRIDASLVLAAAAWLIFNSHTEAFHPYPWMAADGMLGNSLFYFISGFGIQSSLSARRQGFAAFSARRLSRIYVPLFITAIVFRLTIDRDTSLDVTQALTTYVYPTHYTYIKVILPCYAGLWGLNRTSMKWYQLSAGVALVLMIGGYIEHALIAPQPPKLVLGELPELLWNSYFWILVVSGALCARWKISATPTLGRMLLVGALLVAYLILKFLFLVEDRFAALYPVLFLLVYAICVLSLTTFGSPPWVKRVMQIPLLGAFLGLSSAITLEIYLVHEPLSHFAPLSSLPYPMNLAALLGLTIPFAIAVSIASASVQRRIEQAALGDRKPKPPDRPT